MTEQKNPNFSLLIKNIPLSLVTIIQGLNIADFITTQIALNNGGIELNPYYNLGTFTFKTLLLFSFMLILYKNKLNGLKYHSVIIVLGFFLPTFIFTVINNIYVIGELI